MADIERAASLLQPWKLGQQAVLHNTNCRITESEPICNFILVSLLELRPRGGGVAMVTVKYRPAPAGYRWVFCRYRRVKNSTRVLDAHDYGLECWAFLVHI